ncbi:MAG: PilZ domain-containing protein [Polyangiales bacterium]
MLQTVEVLPPRSEVRRQVDIECQLVSDFWDVPIEHHVLDLSSQGMWLSCDYPLHVGEEVVVELTPPARDPSAREPLFLFGRVCRVQMQRRKHEDHKAGMAIQFFHDSELTADRLAAALVGIPPKLGAPRAAARECVWVEELN